MFVTVSEINRDRISVVMLLTLVVFALCTLANSIHHQLYDAQQLLKQFTPKKRVAIRRLVPMRPREDSAGEVSRRPHRRLGVGGGGPGVVRPGGGG